MGSLLVGALLYGSFPGAVCELVICYQKEPLIDTILKAKVEGSPYFVLCKDSQKLFSVSS